MKGLNKIAVCLAGGLALNAGLRAETAPLTGNPYALVVTRNIFGLNPPVVADLNPAPVEPPVKITLNGIMDVFGQVKALYKVAGKGPGKEDSYMLTEGQGKDDIDVVKIDVKKGEVTFNNHGVPQVVALAAAAASSLPAAVTAAVTGNPGISGIPAAAPSGTFGSSGFSTTFGGRPATGISAPAATAGASGGIRPIATRGQPQAKVDPAMQTIMIEANRMKAQNDGDPVAKIYPPTVLSQPADSGEGIPPAP